MSNFVKCSSCNIVINEVLAFICNKIDVMDEESISRICVTAFSDSEIVSAKNLLFESISTEKRKRLRKRQGKTARNIEDIICLLKETDPEDIPIFVARELQKLPPVLFDHVDVTRLLKDLLKMRSDIDRITNEYVTVKQLDALKLDVENLKTVSIVNNFQREEDRFCGVNMVRGAGLLKSFNYDSGPMGLPHMCSNNSLEQSHCVTSTPSGSSQRKQTIEGSSVKKQSHTPVPQIVEGSSVEKHSHTPLPQTMEGSSGKKQSRRYRKQWRVVVLKSSVTRRGRLPVIIKQLCARRQAMRVRTCIINLLKIKIKKTWPRNHFPKSFRRANGKQRCRMRSGYLYKKRN